MLDKPTCLHWLVAWSIVLLVLLPLTALPVWWLMNTIAGYVAFSYMQAYGVVVAINFVLLIIKNNFSKA